MLYQVATGLLSADEIAGPLRSILSRQKNIDVLLDEVTCITAKEAEGGGCRSSTGSRAAFTNRILLSVWVESFRPEARY